MFDTNPGSHIEQEVSCEYTLLLVELSELLHKAGGLIPNDGDWGIAIDPNARNFDPAKRFSEDFSNPPDTHALVLCYPSRDSNLGSQHPSPSQIPFYWQTFVENVNLLVRGLLGQEKETLINQYRCATEQALARAEFMTSTDLITLQAFVLYIFSLRQYAQPRLTWNLTALAVRIAQGIGVHLGPNPQESPFDLEARRRLWLCLWMLDLKTALDLGTEWLIADDCIHVGPPLNIDDSDLDPAYTEHPTSRTGMTDMAHMLVKYEIGLLFKKLTHARGQKGPRPSSEDEMEELVAKCKEQIQERYLGHCADGGLEWLTAANAKLSLATAPLLIHHPVLSSELRHSVSNTLRDRLVAASIETIECLHVLETMPPPHRRGWMFGTYLHCLGMPWDLFKLVEKGKRIHEVGLVSDGQGPDGKDAVVPPSTARIGVSAEIPRPVDTTSSNLSDIRGSISSMRHELHSIPDGFPETPNSFSRIGLSGDDAMSFETSSVRPNFPEFNEQIIPGGSHSVSEFTDNLPISEGSLSVNPAFSGLWLTENDASWDASQALTEPSVDNTTEYWAVWNGLVGDLEMQH
ncbi:Zn(2)-C6 fungal-type domain-containing protein [Fusarium falciforme]|uniref:Zn(2)-C6 fungal-type domain-containing protein n=1 Tax=Fusarium falciforme TaxID=195108 RepID=UPI00230096D1|nr:Zn(2)-C6 fungal-type domain-containing protein [Fusarium falciforme]WAO97335.1 Zn(2)-C6 fungal-type domain-containing protein [Fusarium falciforme]